MQTSGKSKANPQNLIESDDDVMSDSENDSQDENSTEISVSEGQSGFSEDHLSDKSIEDTVENEDKDDLEKERMQTPGKSKANPQNLIESDDDVMSDSENDSQDENSTDISVSEGQSGFSEDNLSDNSIEDTVENEDNADLEKESKDLVLMTKDNLSEEVQKSKAVQSQLAVVDSILQWRILLQKSLKAANQLPRTQALKEYERASGQEFSSSLEAVMSSAVTLLQKTVSLKDELIKTGTQDEVQNSESEDENRKKVTRSVSDSEDEDLQTPTKRVRLSSWSERLSASHSQYRDYAFNTLDTWSGRTRVAHGHVSGKHFEAFEASVVQQINHILADKVRLIRRTQVQRSQYPILGEKGGDNIDDEDGNLQDKAKLNQTDPETFDDDDFYHQLLRDLIEGKSANAENSSLVQRHYAELSKLKSKTGKKKEVDTKASKGRKLRYGVHNKLVNFMPAIHCESLGDTAVKELCNSIFGNRGCTRPAST